MDSLQLLEGLRAIAKCKTRGVYPRDRIPVHWSAPAAIICNTDTHDQRGTHWIAMMLNKNRHAVYFDSYGNPPIFQEYTNRLRTNATTFEWNKMKMQCNSSSYCGHYCLVFIYFLTRGYSLEKFCRMFTKDCKKNDKLVYNFYKKHIKRNIKPRKNTRNSKIYQGRSATRLRYVQCCKPAFMYQ